MIKQQILFTHPHPLRSQHGSFIIKAASTGLPTTLVTVTHYVAIQSITIFVCTQVGEEGFEGVPCAGDADFPHEPPSDSRPCLHVVPEESHAG